MTAPRGEGWRKHIRRTLALLPIVVPIVLVITSSSAYGFIRPWIDRADQVVAQNNFRSVVIFLVLSALSAMLEFFSTALIIPVAVGARPWLLVGLLGLFPSVLASALRVVSQRRLSRTTLLVERELALVDLARAVGEKGGIFR